MELDPGKKTPKSQEAMPQRGPYPASRAETVMISPALAADPDPVKIHIGGSVEWDFSKVEIPAGGKVEIKFETNGGPFPHKGDKENPQRGQYKKHKEDQGNKPTIVTLTEDVHKKSLWKYSISKLNSTGEVLGSVDPGVQIIDPPKGTGGEKGN